MTATATSSEFNREVEAFFDRLRSAPACSLLLDYDGTLAPFHVDPARARPYPGVREALNTILEQDRTRLVIVSGRWTRDLRPLLQLSRMPEMWGSHGWERCRTDGHCEMRRPDEIALQALAQADHWAESAIAMGARREQKPASLAIHWRGLPPAAVSRIRTYVMEQWALNSRDKGLEAHDFDGGIELRVPGCSKADAVTAIARESGQAPIAYLGDDMTDEDAFGALGPEDLGILVRPDYRPTRAKLWLKPPGGLLEFLNRWVEARSHAFA